MKILMQWMMAANLPYQTEAIGDDRAVLKLRIAGVTVIYLRCIRACR